MDIIEKTYEELRASIKNIDCCLCDSFHRVWRLEKEDTEEKRRFMEAREAFRSLLKEEESEIIEDQARLKYNRFDSLETLFKTAENHIKKVNDFRYHIFTLSSLLDVSSVITKEDIETRKTDVIELMKSSLLRTSERVNRK